MGRPRVGSSGEGLPRGPAGPCGLRGGVSGSWGVPPLNPTCGPGSDFQTLSSRLLGLPLSSRFPGLSGGLAQEPPRSGRRKVRGTNPRPKPHPRQVGSESASQTLFGGAAAVLPRNPAPSGTPSPARLRRCPGSRPPPRGWSAPLLTPEVSGRPRPFPPSGLHKGPGCAGEGRPTPYLRPWDLCRD